ncbi:MAG: four-carbon acid sugar kinase family protein, partial [Synechococcus sp.]
MALRPTFAFDRRLVVFDDDPTGSQTVWGCPLLLRWDAESLRQALEHPSPLLFLITNSRALAPAEARARVEAISAALAEVLRERQRQGRPLQVQLISRGDSTLRGHCPLELEVLQQRFGPFDATFVVPAFLPGGRTTEGGVHRLHGQPVHETAFARDGLFGYRSSHLPSWLEERSGGRPPGAAGPRGGPVLVCAATPPTHPG